VLYRNGNGVKQDYAEAMRWFQRSAEQDHSSAQANLGRMYEKGLASKQDYGKALELFSKAAEQGNPFAYADLGGMYLHGFGIISDAVQA